MDKSLCNDLEELRRLGVKRATFTNNKVKEVEFFSASAAPADLALPDFSAAAVKEINSRNLDERTAEMLIDLVLTKLPELVNGEHRKLLYGG